MTALLKKLLSICQSGWREIQIALPLQGRIQKFLMGGGGGGKVQTLVHKGPLNFFVANYFSHRRPRVSQAVNAGRRWRGGEQIIRGYPKTMTFLNIPGI